MAFVVIVIALVLIILFVKNFKFAFKVNNKEIEFIVSEISSETSEKGG